MSAHPPRIVERAQRGWPKELCCLVCDRTRLARSPSDRIHKVCRDTVARIDVGPGGVLRV